jgi:hypothetical protein
MGRALGKDATGLEMSGPSLVGSPLALTNPFPTRLPNDASCCALQGLLYEGRSGRKKDRGVEPLDKTLFMRACREGGAAIEQALRELDRAFFAIL